MMHSIQLKLAGILTGALVTLGLAATASAQPPVVVVIDPTVAELIAVDLDIDVENVPVTVQAPIGVAANVCGVAVNVLTQEFTETGTAECTAETTSTAFNQIVQSAIL
jgi:hypothetical protein